MSKLNFAELRKANASRAPRWHTSEAGIMEWTVGDWFMAMAGEVGEGADELLPLMFMSFVGKLGQLGNMAKKYRRVQEGIANKSDDPERHIHADNAISKMFEELADVQIYLDLFALRLREMLDYPEDIGDHVERKFNKTSEQYGFPERLIDGKFRIVHKDDEPGIYFHPESDEGRRISKSLALAAADKPDILKPTIETQNAEFDAVKGLTEAYRSITMTPAVDDDYPMVRGRYESAMMTLLRAIKANGRTLPPWR